MRQAGQAAEKAAKKAEEPEADGEPDESQKAVPEEDGYVDKDWWEENSKMLCDDERSPGEW